MAKEKDKKEPDLTPIKAVILGTAFLLDFYNSSKKAEKDIKELKAQVAEQKQKIFELELLVKGYETSQPLRVEVCAACDGVGAFMVRGEPEECVECDGAGWKEQIQKD